MMTHMKILDQPVRLSDLKPLMAKMFGNLVKGAVDIERRVVALDAELHSDLAEALVADGSHGNNIWGFDVYPEVAGADWLEFDSMINLKPQLNNRSRGIEDLTLRAKAEQVIKKFIIP